MNYGQQAAGQSKYIDNCPEAVSPCSELDGARNRLAEVLNFAEMQGERIENIEAKLNGGACATAGQTAQNPRPVPNGTIGQMGQILDDIMARLQRTDAAVSRLRSAI